MVDLFLGEVVTFISVIDGIRDISEARFIMQLLFLTVQMYIDYCGRDLNRY
jgi:hypothetical protein